MIKVVTAQQMRQIDSQTIDTVGIPGIVLMERASLAVLELVKRLLPNKGRVSIFAAKGNNGGDGLAVARHLLHNGYEVSVYLVSEASQFSGDAKSNLQILQNLNFPLKSILEESDLALHKSDILASDLFIDAIFGTGLKGVVRGFIAELIEFLNSSSVPILAIDLPSGLEADAGQIHGACIKAAYTVTIGLPKRGLLLYPGAKYVGQLSIADIGFPAQVIESQNILVNLMGPADAKRLLPSRPKEAHKGSFGHVFLVSGSEGLTGAATLSSLAVLRSGAGMATLAIPKSLNDIMEVKLTEVMTLPLEETEARSLSKKALDKILHFLQIRKVEVLAIGPGLSRHPDTVTLVHELVQIASQPKVIDADALNAISEKTELLDQLGENSVLTPHLGEMSRLLGCSAKEIEADRINMAQSFAKTHKLNLVLKGAPTVIADPYGNAYLNSTGNPGMATAGMGDVLTGVIAGLLAQGLSPINAAISGVYLHGMAGDIAASQKGEHGIIATDVLEALPSAIMAIKNL